MKKVSPRSEKLSRMVTNNLPLKVVALAASVVLFSLVHSDQDAQRSLLVDVVALLPPPGSKHMLISELPHQVKVTLRGSRSRLGAVQRDDFPPLQMDLTDPSRRYYYFEPDAIDVGGLIQVAEISPNTISLEWAVSEERSVPVRARLRGAPGEGFTVKLPVGLQPEKVTVRGPQETVRGIQAAYTDVVQVDGLGAGKHERRVRLEPQPEHVTYLEEVEVDVAFEVVPELAEKTFRRLEVAVVGEDEATLRPDRVAVTLRGTARALSILEPDHLVPVVEFTPQSDGGTSGTRPRPVKVRGVPEGFELVRVVPESVLVRLKRR